MSGGHNDIKVWDPFVRLFHWSLAGLVLAMWYTADQGEMDWHRRLGLTLLGVLVFRLYWGFAGPHTARFATYPLRPRQILAYIPTLFKGNYKAHVGHNPLASLSVIALIAVITGQVIGGLFAIDTDGLESGPLARFISFETGREIAELHEMNFNIILGLIILHLCAIAYYAIALGTDLVSAMVHGKRDVDDETAAAAPPVTVKPIRVIIGLILAAATVWIIVWLGG